MSSSGSGIPHQVPPAWQATATLNQANPVSGTQYVLLDTTLNCRVIACSASCTWTVQPNPLQLHIEIDGQPQVAAEQGNPVSTTTYHGTKYGTGAQIISFHTNDYTYTRPYLVEGKSIRLTCEITGGTVQNLSGTCKYQKW